MSSTITAQGTEDTQKTFSIFDRESSKNGSPIVKTVNLSYSKIQNAFIKVQILADTTSTVSGLPAILGGGFELTKININGKDFTPNNKQNAMILIQDIYAIDQSLHKVLNPNGENTISVSFTAPFGAGVISPNVQFNSQLIVLGTETIQSKLGFTGLPSTSDVISQANQWISNNTLPFFAIVILAAIIIIGLAVLAIKVIP